LTKPVLSPEEAMRQAAERIARGENVSIMFGPERSGLENEDIAQANAIVSVPVNPDFPSLNLAQCVLLLGYEWRRATQTIQGESMEMAKTEWAETGEIEKLSEHFETTLDQAGFFFPKAKAEGMKTNLRNLWSRMPLTRSDVQIFHGMMRQMVRWKNRDGD
jgi:tRNA/rRNA methyltransferase